MKLHQLREMAIGPKYDGDWYWHITTESAARQIAKEGHLKATEVAFEKGNWAPRPGRVYLTNDPDQIRYYYNIRWSKSKKPRYMGVIRIDASKVRDTIEPDEDEINEILYSATEVLQWRFGDGKDSDAYKEAMKIIQALPKAMQRRAKRLLEKDYNPEQERRRGAWLRFTKEAIPLLKGSEVWDELMKKAKSGSVQGPIPVDAVWLVDTEGRHHDFSWKDIVKSMNKYAERIL